MIPKIIHYCWFGGNPLPKSAQKCIDSWRKYFPDYDIKEWNEDNFDIAIIPYTKAAYEAKKYAFVSDYARFWVLYHYGGVYFDTDVEVVKSMEDILNRGGFMGCEIDQPETFAVAPGLGIAIEPHHPLYQYLLEMYNGLPFYLKNGEMNPLAIVRITTAALLKYGLQRKACIQDVQGITVYPADYFNPLDDATGRLKITPNTRSIHWYSKTWIPTSPLKTKLIRLCHRYFGVNCFSAIKSILKK
ncbi:glycosyltransferase family 32 protein [Bacteroides faecium]|uniref:Glycosyl transferase n=1 Tax=Bacteroides faecium TaxID=2715212 RepID=A0A6H0KRL3_9BACE|nr:glycosyltransferase [Bacteroides faecium]QIU95148.1 glycosyl transferase [Bacteroides faecium]